MFSDLTPQLLEIMRHYGYVIVFLGTIIAGETVILAASFLAFLGFFNIFIVVGVGFAGTAISDSIWYYAGRRFQGAISFLGRFVGFSKIKTGFWEKHFDRHYGKFLIASKFIYGIRAATLIASGHQKIKYKRFLRYNLISIGIWIVLMVCIGYFIGFSWDRLQKFNGLAEYLLLGIIVLVILIRFLFNRYLKKKEL